MKFKRVYHAVESWEEIKAGMWAEEEGMEASLTRAVEFTGNHALYGSFMRRVVREWPISCENALTDYSLNQKAWLGHAACAMAIGCTESITRKAWGYLTDEQQFLANREAAGAIREWRNNYAKNHEVCGDMGSALLFGRDT